MTRPPAPATPPPGNAGPSDAARSRAQRTITEVSSSVAVLRTEADRARGMMGFGRRILVPPDEIHVVVGDGRHSFAIASDRKVFGQTADRPSRYWLNALTQVIKLKTISFTVPIRGLNDDGVEALDSSKVSFRLWAHAVAKLNPEKAVIAAQRVGLDTTGLINTITEVGTAELVAAAATMSLEDIIANRQKLAEITFPKVNHILSELGYDLALLTITQLDGPAYQKLVEQAEARISKETAIATNREQVAELQDRQSRERTESEINAATEKKLAAERLDAQREVETKTYSQQEALAISRHEVQVRQVERDRKAAEAAHATNLAKVQLARTLSEAEVDKEAQIARLQAEREAELRAVQHKRAAEIRLAESRMEAERLALEQARKIERAAEITEAEARRLREEELAAAERAREVALVEAEQIARSLEVEAQGQSRALQVKVEAETRAELVRAEAEASATEKRAHAAKARAEATRAETAAPGLAEAEVETARVKVAEQRVSVTRAEGLTRVEVDRAQAAADAERQQKLREVEINAQRQLSELYSQAPVLVDLEKVRMQYAHQERLASLRAETYLKTMEAIAPGLRVNVFGNGGQAGQLLTDVLSISHGLRLLGEEVPAVGSLLAGSNGHSAANGRHAPEAADGLARLWMDFAPYVRQALAGVNPRVFSSLRVADVVERLVPVLQGREDLLTSLNGLRQQASFRVVGDLPVGPILDWLGAAAGSEPPAPGDEGLPGDGALAEAEQREAAGSSQLKTA
jgi:hypothetical protein